MRAAPSLPASVVAGALVAVIGAVASAGRTQPRAALTLLLLGTAVALLPRGVSGAGARVIRRAVAACALLAGGLAVAEASVTALGLTMSALAFLLLDLGRAAALGQILALATGVLGILNVAGHASRLQGLAGYTPVAAHVAVALVLLSAGMLLARPERGLVRIALADTPGGVVVRRLLPVVIGAPVLLGWLVEVGRRGGAYGPELARALTALATVVVLAGGVWWAASTLQRTDVGRRRAEAGRRVAAAEIDRAVARSEELAETTTRLRTLERLNRLVSSSLDYDAVLHAIARAAGDIMATPVVSFWVADEAARTVSVRAWSDAGTGADFPFPSFTFGQGMVGTVAATRAPLHIPDVFAEPGMLRAHDWCARHGLRSFYGVPVLAQDRLLAVLVLSGRAPLDLAEEDRELLASFVAQAAISLDNARLFAEAQERRQAAERAATAEREAEALRAVAQLANAAAHEINNPLAVIMAHLDLLARRYQNDAQTVQRIDRARDAARRIADMIVHMGRITRLELSEQSPNLPPILDLRRSSEQEPA